MAFSFGTDMELIKYRDAGMSTYTYFWTIDKRVVSPYFDSETEALDWEKENNGNTSEQN